MKAILLTRTGDPSVLEYVDVPTPRPRSDEVLVKADTIGVSRPEILVRTGVYEWMPTLPAIPGIEMSGTVVEVGPDAGGVAVGQRVFITARELTERAGCYAEYIAVPARAVFRLPAETDMEAAACLANYQVAYHVLHTAVRPVPGGTAVIDAAGGGIGSAVVELARLAGMAAIAIVGGPPKAEALKAFGAEHVIDYLGEDVPARVGEITRGRGADLVLDSVGGKRFAQNFSMLAAFGTVVSYGKLAGLPEEKFVEHLNKTAYMQSPAVRVFTMHTLDDKPAIRAKATGWLIEQMAGGALRPLIHARLPLSDARRAHEMLEAREVIGKVLLKP